MVSYVTGEPEAEYSSNGSVLAHFPVGEDETVTLAFKSDAHYQSAMETLDRSYLFASTAQGVSP